MCGDMVDNDCDMRTDCRDPDCVGDPACGCTATKTDCGNGTDDDCDGATDCADSDCAARPGCRP